MGLWQLIVFGRWVYHWVYHLVYHLVCHSTWTNLSVDHLSLLPWPNDGMRKVRVFVEKRSCIYLQA